MNKKLLIGVMVVFGLTTVYFKKQADEFKEAFERSCERTLMYKDAYETVTNMLKDKLLLNDYKDPNCMKVFGDYRIYN